MKTVLLFELKRLIGRAVQDCPAMCLNWFNSKPWGIIIADNWSTKLSCKRWRTNLPAGPYRWLGAVSFSLVLEEDWLGFHVFDFSAFRLFGFSAFRLFGFSAFRLFGFSIQSRTQYAYPLHTWYLYTVFRHFSWFKFELLKICRRLKSFKMEGSPTELNKWLRLLEVPYHISLASKWLLKSLSLQVDFASEQCIRLFPANFFCCCNFASWRTWRRCSRDHRLLNKLRKWNSQKEKQPTLRKHLMILSFVRCSLSIWMSCKIQTTDRSGNMINTICCIHRQ